ncbi:Heterokaryon incompatibility protein (HET) domain containing protein [Hyaloscypha variabilis]
MEGMRRRNIMRPLEPSRASQISSGVECFLKDTTLAECRDDIGDHYIALSYVWGDQTDKRSISVDGRRLEITASLDSALRYIRDYRRVFHIWADGVCINRKDTHDRNRQVRLMGDIYSTAQHTIIFLGLSPPRCDSIMLLMASATQPYIGSEEDSDRAFRNLLTGYEAIVEEEILSRPWFTRVWILQELVLSQNPWIQCGKIRARWNLFCKSILSSESSVWKPDSRAVLQHMRDTRNDFAKTSLSAPHESQKEPGEALFILLQQRRGCGLTDPRDLIYAHLGLVDAETRKLIPIDYDKSVAQFWLGDISSNLPGPYDAFNQTKLYQEHRKKEQTLASFNVPHVMVVPGWCIGTIKAIIPMSALPKKVQRSVPPHLQSYDLLSDEAMVSSLLDWARRHLIAFIATGIYPYGYFKNEIPKGWPKLTGLEKKRFTQIVSIMSRWPEITSEGAKLGFRGSTRKKESFVISYIRVLLFILEHHLESEPMAALDDTSLLVQIPSLAHTGDYVVDFHFVGGSFAILRPHDVALSKEEESRIRKDFSVHRMSDQL